MWIRSQNKECLLKCNTINIEIEECSSKYVVYENLNNSQKAILGYYKSKERAIEVLDEIQACISNLYKYEVMPQHKDNYFTSHAVPYKEKIYEMPKE